LEEQEIGDIEDFMLDTRQRTDGPILLPNLYKLHVIGKLDFAWALVQNLPEPACQFILDLRKPEGQDDISLWYPQRHAEVIERVSGFWRNKTGQQILPNRCFYYKPPYYGGRDSSCMEFGFPDREGSLYIAYVRIEAYYPYPSTFWPHTETLHLQSPRSTHILREMGNKDLSCLRSIVIELEEPSEEERDIVHAWWSEYGPSSCYTIEDLTFKNCHSSWRILFNMMKDNFSGFRVHWEKDKHLTGDEEEDVDPVDLSGTEDEVASVNSADMIPM
jgi:hypothetical protein